MGLPVDEIVSYLDGDDDPLFRPIRSLRPDGTPLDPTPTAEELNEDEETEDEGAVQPPLFLRYSCPSPDG
jgi:hypothetical protein